MENLVFTQLSVPEIRQLFRKELESFFSEQSFLPAKPEAEILTVDQTADFLKLAKQTVYQLVSAREIPFSKRGKRLYFNRHELEQWIAEGRKATKAEIKRTITH